MSTENPSINITQNNNKTVEKDADDEVKYITLYPINWQRCQQSELSIKDLKKETFESVKSSLGWNGTDSYTFCFSHFSYLQQKVPDSKGSHVI